MATHNETGKKGEQLAKEFLEANNYVILETNYRYKKAEIDIIALKNNILAIIEVKTRTSIDFGEPESFVNNKKRSEEHTSELQSRENLVCRLLLEKKKKTS